VELMGGVAEQLLERGEGRAQAQQLTGERVTQLVAAGPDARLPHPYRHQVCN